MASSKLTSAQRKVLLSALKGQKVHGTMDLSPNDVLVQIALPLVLILAIVIQLLTVAQTVETEKVTEQTDEGPVLLDLWKQQLILRIDRTFALWEDDSGIVKLSDFDRIKWESDWPEDDLFQELCTKGLELGNIKELRRQIYNNALEYNPEEYGESEESAALFIDLYDPEAENVQKSADEIPPEYWIDNERRAYAFSYIEERCLKWKETLENIQWATVEKIVAVLPIDSELTNKNLATQMDNISQALNDLGYPLLPSVIQEYNKNE